MEPTRPRSWSPGIPDREPYRLNSPFIPPKDFVHPAVSWPYRTRAATPSSMEPEMTTRIQSIAVLLMIGAALAASPALAAGAVPGNRGAAEKAQNRDAPLTLPGKISPRPTPRVDAASLSRGIFDEDQVAALASLGTVTFSADGSVVETPASEALRGIFEIAVQGHKTK